MNRDDVQNGSLKPVAWWTWVVWLCTIAIGFWMYPHLPSRVATHFSASGAVNGYMPKLQAVIILPAIMLGIILLWHVIWKADPKRASYPKFWPTYRLIGGVIVIFMALIQVWTLAHAVNFVGASSRTMLTLVGILILLLSNWMPRVRQNWAIGIRTPWTLASEACWRLTHQFAGQLGVVAGALSIVIAWVLPMKWSTAFVLVVILAWAAASTVASYVFYKREG